MIEYIDETHTYLNSKGVEIPSVSDLVNFATGNGYELVDPLTLQRKADYGTKVHEILEAYDKGEKDKAYEMAVGDDNMLNALADYADLKKKWLIYPKTQEVIVSYKERYAGRYDKLDDLGKLWDVKTTVKKDLTKWSLQLGFYYLALGSKEKEAYVIWLPKKGKSQVIPIEVADREKCLKILEAYEEDKKQSSEKH